MANGSMQGGGMGMMGSMMMGKDPVGSCTSMMKKIAADPVLHRRMNSVMHDAMNGSKK
ncbi:MAG: hypothetical protein M3R44_07810 [Candidatus Eremiobacteraeota bacterium]|nr:hypothetical protein [Candidatus Eremiobacteraeota bacterium]